MNGTRVFPPSLNMRACAVRDRSRANVEQTLRQAVVSPRELCTTWLARQRYPRTCGCDLLCCKPFPRYKPARAPMFTQRRMVLAKSRSQPDSHHRTTINKSDGKSGSLGLPLISNPVYIFLGDQSPESKSCSPIKGWPTCKCVIAGLYPAYNRVQVRLNSWYGELWSEK